MSKIYKLKNGYRIKKQDFYTGNRVEFRWCVFSPEGEFLYSYSSYEKAYNAALNEVKRGE